MSLLWLLIRVLQDVTISLLSRVRQFPPSKAPRPSSCPYSPECMEEEFSKLRIDGVLGGSPCASYGGIMPAVEEVGQPEKRVGKEERYLWTSTRRCSATRSIRRNSSPISA